MSANLDLSNQQIMKIVKEHIEGMQSNADLHKFIIHVLRLSSRWDDLGWVEIRDFVNKQANKQRCDW